MPEMSVDGGNLHRDIDSRHTICRKSRHGLSTYCMDCLHSVWTVYPDMTFWSTHEHAGSSWRYVMLSERTSANAMCSWHSTICGRCVFWRANLAGSIDASWTFFLIQGCICIIFSKHSHVVAQCQGAKIQHTPYAWCEHYLLDSWSSLLIASKICFVPAVTVCRWLRSTGSTL